MTPLKVDILAYRRIVVPIESKKMIDAPFTHH